MPNLSKIVAARRQVEEERQAFLQDDKDVVDALVTLVMNDRKLYDMLMDGKNPQQVVLRANSQFITESVSRLRDQLKFIKKDVAKALEAQRNRILKEGSFEVCAASFEDLPQNQMIVFLATVGMKNTYMGKKNLRYLHAWAETGLTIDEWKKAKKELVASKLLRSNGALAPAAKKMYRDADFLSSNVLGKIGRERGWSVSKLSSEYDAMEDKLQETEML
jgi:hypothetical protein